mgnify:CR=1 FL=1
MRIANERLKTYNFHNLLCIRCNTDFCDNTFSSFTSEENFEPSITVNIGISPKWHEQDLERVNVMFYYLEDFHGVYFSYPWLFRIRAAITGIDSLHTEIFLSNIYLRFSELVNQGFSMVDIFKSIMMVKLLSLGNTLLHAGCLDANGAGILIPAFANVGKTSTCLALSKRDGVTFLADDMTCIDDSALALSLPMTSLLSRTTAQELGVADVCKLARLALIEGVGFLMSNRFINSGMRVKPQSILGPDKIGTQTTIRTIAFLQHGNESMSEIDKDEAVKKLLAINRHELPWSGNPMIHAFAFFSNQFDIQNLLHTEQRILRSVVDAADRCLLVTARRGRHWTMLQKVVAS